MYVNLITLSLIAFLMTVLQHEYKIVTLLQLFISFYITYPEDLCNGPPTCLPGLQSLDATPYGSCSTASYNGYVVFPISAFSSH